MFAIGEHHNPPFFSSSPTTLLAYIAATTKRLIVTTATTLITTNDPVRVAEEYAMLQHLSKGRMDLMIGRGNTGPVYPWFGQDIRQGLPLALENYNLLHRLWREDVVDWEGKFRTPLQGFTSIPRPLDDVPPFVWHGSIRTPEIADPGRGQPGPGQRGIGAGHHGPGQAQPVQLAEQLVRAGGRGDIGDVDVLQLQLALGGGRGLVLRQVRPEPADVTQRGQPVRDQRSAAGGHGVLDRPGPPGALDRRVRVDQRAVHVEQDRLHAAQLHQPSPGSRAP